MSLESEVVYTDGTNTTADYNASGATTTHGILFEITGSYLKAYINLASGLGRTLTMSPYSDVRFVGVCFYANPALAQVSGPLIVTATGVTPPGIYEPSDTSTYTQYVTTSTNSFTVPAF